jgi:hypothetical protein
MNISVPSPSPFFTPYTLPLTPYRPYNMPSIGLLAVAYSFLGIRPAL